MAGGDFIGLALGTATAIALVYLVCRALVRTVWNDRPNLPPLSIYGDFIALPREARQQQNHITGGRGGETAAGAQRTTNDARTRHGRGQ